MGKKLLFVAGLVIGLSIGWAVGILSSPQFGQETLDEISLKAIELRKRAEEAGQAQLPAH